MSPPRKVPPVLRRLQRPAAATICALLLVPALAACGSSDSSSSKDSSSKASSKLDDSVTFSGEVGKSIKPAWKAKAGAQKSTTVTTLVKGKGDKIASGDTVSTYLWVGNGSTKKAAYSDYDNGAAESVPNNTQLSPLFQKLFKDATYGSRVAAIAPASDLFGGTQGNSQLGIGAKDTIVLVADFVKKAPVSPTPSDDKVHEAPANKLPKVVSKGGKPTGFDWSGIKEPSLSTPVQRVVLKKGNGAVVAATDTLTVNYLGATYKGEKPFDESYTKQPLTSPLGSLVKGWAIGLTGVKVGSRVLIQIPPAYGYGAQGSGAIPGNATLWFVIDVVKATKG
jgi:peptidylprolyl isomerase